MKASEEVAVLTALQKAVKARLDEARARLDEEFEELHESCGVERRALTVGGARVGEQLMVTEAGHWEVEDEAGFGDFALTYGLAHEERSIRPGMMESCVKALEDVFEPDVLAEAVETRVVPDAGWERYVTNVGGLPAFLDTGLTVPGLRWVPARMKGTQVRGCKPEDVLPLVGSLEGGVEGLLLGEGE